MIIKEIEGASELSVASKAKIAENLESKNAKSEFGRMSILEQNLLSKTGNALESQNSEETKKAQKLMKVIRNEKKLLKESNGAGMNLGSLGNFVPVMLPVVEEYFFSNIAEDIAPSIVVDAMAGMVARIKPTYANKAAGVTAGDVIKISNENGSYNNGLQKYSVTATAGKTFSLTGESFKTAFPRVGTANAKIVPGTLHIVVRHQSGDAFVNAYDTGVRNQTASSVAGLGIDASAQNNKITYATGEISFTTAESMAETDTISLEFFVEADRVLANQEEEGLKDPKVTSIGVEIAKRYYEVQPHLLALYYTKFFEMAASADVFKGKPVDQSLQKIAVAELKNNKDMQVIAKLVEFAAFDASLQFDATARGTVNKITQYEDIQLIIRRAQQLIGKNLVDYVVVGGNAEQVLACHKDFVPAPKGDNKLYKSWISGTINGMKVIYSQWLDPNAMYFGSYGLIPEDSAIINLEYAPFVPTTALTTADLKVQQGFASLYLIEENSPQYLKKGVISNF